MKNRSKEIFEIVGVAGVIASLIFVGLQMVFDRRIAVASVFHERTIMLQDAQIAQLQSSEVVLMRAKAWEAGDLPSWWNDEIEQYRQVQNLTMEDMVRRAALAQMQLLRLNDIYFQYTKGLIPEATWESLKPSNQNYSNSPLDSALAGSWNALEPEYRKLVLEAVNAQKVQD